MSTTVQLSKLSKTGQKQLRKELILEALDNDTYNRYNLAKQFHVHERTIRRYINEIAEELCNPHDDRMRILRAKCLGNLTKKVNDGLLDDDLMVKLLVSGEPKKLESKHTEEIREIKLTWIKDESHPSDTVQAT